ncbi:MAG: alcohol dehydrogenase catalytic domain-containing protein [bacterium]|nr:alcohol dehydrogenase catalytic domain-containing protein [bacterium]
MKGLVFDGSLALKQIDAPAIPIGEALIKVLVSGICNTDLEICRGYMGYKGVLGHEFVGIVEAFAPGTDPAVISRWQGKRVVGEINCGCGKCLDCLAGDTRHCPNRTTLGIDRRNGTMAEYCLLPVENLYEVPENVSDRQAVFTEPLAAAWEIAAQLHICPNHEVAVFGDGKLGLLVALVLRLSGCSLTLVGKHPEKMKIAEDAGVKTCLASVWQARQTCDIAVEATGTASGLNIALNSVKSRGIVVLKSTIADNTQVDCTQIVVREITVMGSRCGRFAPALRSLASGSVDVLPLISAEYSLDNGEEAFRKAHGSLKVLIFN